MSRIRSQLENLMTEEEASGTSQSRPGTFRPAYRGTDGQNAVAGMSPRQELERIQGSIDQLMAQMASSARRQPQMPESQSRPTGAASDALRLEIQSGFQELRQELASTAQTIAHSQANLQQNGTEAYLRQIGDKLEEIRNNPANPSEIVDQLQAELAGLHQGMSSLLEREQAQTDLSPITESIEAGYSEIVSRLDAALSANQRTDPETDYSPHFHALSEQMQALAKTVESTSGSRGSGGMVEVSGDVHAFERIEARLASLAKSVDHLLANGLEAVDGEVPAGVIERLDTISSDVARLQHADVGSSNNGLANVERKLAELAERVGDLTRIAEEASAGGDEEAYPDMAGMEQRLAEIASRLETVTAMPETAYGPGNDEVLDLLRNLSEKVDRFANSLGGANSSDLKSLESQMASLASAIASGSGGEMDFDPINQRLENIEGQLASSRDIVIDMASEMQAKMAASGGADPAIIEPVMAELKSLRESLSSALETSGDEEAILAEISARLADIADRISGIEAASLAALGAGGKRNQSRNQPSDALDRKFSTAAEESVAMPAMSAGDRMQDQPVRQEAPEPQRVESAPPMQPEIDEASETAALEEGILEEDVPLAPGSGMPDLESLVRKAKQIKRDKPQTGSRNASETEEEENDGIADLMAAARRAAQAASAEAEIARDPKASKKKLNPIGKFKLPSFINRKILMASAAVVIVASAGLMIAPSLFGGGNQPARQAVTSQSSPEAGKTMTTGDEMPEAAADPDGASVQADLNAAQPANEMPPSDEEMQTAGAMEGVESSDLLSGAAEPADSLSATDTGLQGTENFVDSQMGQSLNPAPGSEADMAYGGEMPPAEIGNDALRAAAASGNGDALFEVARRYTDGIGIDRNLEKAAEWYSQAAELGHAPAQYRIGNFYEKGHGVAVDPKAAAEWYGKAAAQGNALAMHNLAVLHAMGLVDGDANMDEALAWFEKAANLGVKDSQVNLGILFTKGMGVSEDLEQAYKWFAVAAKGGDTDAAKKRDTVAQAMRPEQLERARGAAEIWKPQELVQEANFASVADEWKSGASQKLSMSKAEMVRKAQALLSTAGFDAGPVDGMMGERTRQAIMSFQKKSGLPVDGEVSPALLDELSKQSI